MSAIIINNMQDDHFDSILKAAIKKIDDDAEETLNSLKIWIDKTVKDCISNPMPSDEEVAKSSLTSTLESYLELHYIMKRKIDGYLIPIKHLNPYQESIISNNHFLLIFMMMNMCRKYGHNYVDKFVLELYKKHYNYSGKREDAVRHYFANHII